ncbi:class I glutamine amidotransferase-like protein [Pisolithus marmoratus]|nr:class I glutamine amidotransferase-like protein [Pisolithus marmoratus]
MAEIHDHFDTILILDFGSQYSHLITRRCRELNVYAELMPCTALLKDIQFKPKGIILSGSPYSVYDADAPHVDPAIFELGVPILGICYGLQELAWNFKGQVTQCDHREYGHAAIQISRFGNGNDNSTVDSLFDDLGDEMQVWMSHGDQLQNLPPDFHVIGHTQTAPFAAIAHDSKPIYGIQFHPEVTHSLKGREVISRFVINICGCRTNWTMHEFIGKEIARIRDICGPRGRVIGAASSTSSQPSLPSLIAKFHAIMVDNGVLRLNEAKQVEHMLKENLGVNLTVVDASELFLSRLDGVEDPEQKRKIIGNTFIHVFEAEASKIEAAAQEEERAGAEAKGKIEWLLQGTLYPDVIESISFKGPSATIKTHHNVGGLLKDMKLKLIEPLRELFKDEVRALGRLLSIPEPLVKRHPFPGPGLAIRILGPVTREQVKILQQADNIYIEEIRNANLYDQISQAFAVLLPVQAVGVMGDKRTYEQVIALRAVTSEDFMTADWYVLTIQPTLPISSSSDMVNDIRYVFPADVLRRISSRITNEVSGINRVTYDISSKPPATVEWL